MRVGSNCCASVSLCLTSGITEGLGKSICQSTDACTAIDISPLMKQQYPIQVHLGMAELAS